MFATFQLSACLLFAFYFQADNSMQHPKLFHNQPKIPMEPPDGYS